MYDYYERKCNDHRAGRYRPRGCAFPPGLLELHIYGRVYDPERAPYHSWVRRGIDHEPRPKLKSTSGVGVSTPCVSVYTRGMTVFVPGFLDLYMYGRIVIRGWEIIVPGCGGTARLHDPQPTINQPAGGWGFHTLRGGIGPRDVRFRLRFVKVVDVWKDF